MRWIAADHRHISLTTATAADDFAMMGIVHTASGNQPTWTTLRAELAANGFASLAGRSRQTELLITAVRSQAAGNNKSR
jgi:hypothetical protein